MATALDTDTMDFDDCVGHLQAYEMEISSTKSETSHGVALTASKEKQEIKEMKEQLSFMSKNHEKAMRRMERGNKKNYVEANQDERHRSSRKSSPQCHECQGFGHYKADCPTSKRREIKCKECKGFGHNTSECVNLLHKKSNSYKRLDESDSSSEDEDSNEGTGYCAFFGAIEESDSEDEVISIKEGESSESESDCEKEFDLKAEYKKIYLSWMTLSEEKLILVGEKLKLEERVVKLQELLKSEVEKRMSAERDLSEMNKQVLMLNSGTKDLDKILASGRVGKSYHGLGYQGVTNTEKINFVSAGFQQEQIKSVPTEKSESGFKTRSGGGCYCCGKLGHIKRYCYRFAEKVQRLLKLGKFFPNKKKTWQVWMAKADLYPTSRVQCHATHTITESRGAAQHMTEDPKVLKNHTTVKEGKVTFDGKAHGKIKGKNEVLSLDAPELMNVRSIPESKNVEKGVCEVLNQGKQIQVVHKKSAENVLERIILCSSGSSKTNLKTHPLEDVLHLNC